MTRKDQDGRFSVCVRNQGNNCHKGEHDKKNYIRNGSKPFRWHVWIILSYGDQSKSEALYWEQTVD